MSTFTESEIELIKKTKFKVKEKLIDFLDVLFFQVNLPKPNIFVSGGCIGSLLREEEPNDIDIYFMDFDTCTKVSDYYIKFHSNDIAEYVDKYGEDVGKLANEKVITNNAITLKNKLQLITKYSGTPEEIRNTFDYVHCKPYFDVQNDKLHISREQFDLNMKKTLKVNNPKFVTNLRLGKFLSKGWKKE